MRHAASLLHERSDCPGPGHGIVPTRSGPEINELGERAGEGGLRIDIVQFASLNGRGDAGPVLRTLIVAGGECLSRQRGEL